MDQRVNGHKSFLFFNVIFVSGQVCLEGEFVCLTEYGPVCQPNIYKCDEEQDCLDNYDEAFCHGKSFSFVG